MADERFKDAESTATEQYAIYVDARLRVWAVPDFNFPSGRTKYVRAADYDSLRTAAQAAITLIVKLYDQGAIPTLMQYEVDGVRERLRGALNPKG